MGSQMTGRGLARRERKGRAVIRSGRGASGRGYEVMERGREGSGRGGKGGWKGAEAL